MRTLAIIGAGHRCYGAFARQLTEKYSDKIKIVGVCDPNVKRCEYYRDTLDADMKIYTDFDLMLNELQPDGVIVATVDAFHHIYIVKALEKGCDVYTEKPMTIDEEKCRFIRDAERRTGKKVTVMFNCRFMPYFAKLKELVSTGVIGKILSVQYDYLLNTKHGGDYFKRWHRFMDLSGGMLVHKATHHFDIVNWILDDDPVSVIALGSKLYFGNDRREHGERCFSCEHKEGCDAYEFIYDEEFLKKMYLDAESEDGYVRDHCAYKSDTDIYDSMSVSVEYRKGTLLTYSLNLFNTDEGYTLNLIGEKGRIETSTFFDGEDYKIIVRYRNGKVDEITFPHAEGTHAGGDERMVDMLFGDLKDDPLGQCSDSFDGMKSIMIGIAANQSIKKGIKIDLGSKLDELK